MWTPTRLAVAGCYGLTGVLNALWGATLPATDARLDLGPARLGVALLVLGLGALVAMPLAGVLAERFTGRGLLLVVAPLFAASLAGPALAGSFGTLVAATLIFGVLLGMVNVALTVQAVDLERAEQRPAMSTLHGVWTLGALGGGVVTAAALRAGADVRLIMIIGAAAAGLTAAGLVRRLPVPVSPAASTADGPPAPGGRAGLPLVLMLSLIGAAAFLTEGAATDWAGVYTRQVLGVDPATASLTYTMFFAAMTAIRLLGDAIRSRVRAPRVVLLAGLTATTGYATVLLAPAIGGAALPVALSGWVLVGAGMALIWPVVSSTLGAAFPGRAKDLSLVTTISYGGGLIGPAVIGGVASRASLPVAMAIPAVLVAVITVIAPRVLAALPVAVSVPIDAPLSGQPAHG
ncbi:MFS transporter [Dactylosporangium cerinum]|uniref:MFS transporter n=1 Tax=Dactylosporangium cerinum TaxID=1434730 RepID=A0ABV9VPP4_9ACTN